MSQTWHNLLFAHWPVDPAVIRPLVPSVFALDVFDRTAWLGIIPFYMTNVAPRVTPSLPGLSEFAELNVRTYVRAEDKPGIYFFSLDAASALAVGAARLLLNLPYYRARMTVAAPSAALAYESVRVGQNAARFAARYRPAGDVFIARPDTIEYFLTERYCLYHLGRNSRPYRLEIHHPPWALQPAEATFDENTMGKVNGVALPDSHRAALLHFATRQDMVAFPPQTL